MTATDHIKILNRKIMQNETQYGLDRKAAYISALTSNNLDKYEYLTGEDLSLKPSTVEKKNLNILHWVCHSVKLLKRIKLKVLLRAGVILIIIAIMLFTDFTKGMMNLRRCH